MRRVYYALGGGRGHRTRARLLRERLGPGTILHQAPADGAWAGTDDEVLDEVPDEVPDEVRLVRPTPAELNAHLEDADHLVVDTFPAGIAHELVLPPHAKTTLVARYLQRAHYPHYDDLVRRFDEVLLPYDPDRCEWDEPPPGTWIGPVHRTLRLRPQVEPSTVDPIGFSCELLVIGGGEPPSWTPLLERPGTVRLDGPFHTLPRARAVIALSAGYNLFWELVATGLPCAFRPLPRRFDDQFRRVGRFGTPLLHRADLEAFLAAHAGVARGAGARALVASHR